MVKSVLSVNHQGLRDWLIQRISAIVMAIYAIGMMAFFVMHANLQFYEWQGLFTHGWVKVATLVTILCLLFHAWVGMWTIFTDYIKCPVARLVLHTLVFFALVTFFFASLLILWSI